MNAKLVFAAVLASASAFSAQVEHIATVREVMVAIIAPSTDVLWGAEQPMNDDRWREIDEAAIAIIAAGSLIASGGAGSDDAEWAQEKEWAAFTDAMIAAAVSARRAAQDKDFDGLMTSGELIYSPCEGCHLVYHPEIRQD